MNPNTLTQTLSAEKLQLDSVIGEFESSDAELNEFLHNDALKYLRARLAATYLVKVEQDIAAYFTLANDALARKGDSKTEWNRLNRGIPNEKRRRSYPAVKIGRLAVSKKYTGQGLGRRILSLVTRLYQIDDFQAGCRFITVDAYHTATAFYEKNGFAFLTTQDEGEETRAMYFDLKALG
jgi:GNAT superfamily N-acetyltransferase